MNKRLSILTTLIVLLILCGSTMETHAKVVGYWSFDNNEHIGEDLSPNHNHGELKEKDRAKWVAGGKVGGGLKLDGGAGLEVPHNESLNLKDQLTLMCWVKFADLNDFSFAQRNRGQSLISKSAPGGHVSYRLYANRGHHLELDLPLYINRQGLLFTWLYVIDPKCKGQFINGIPDFPARCQRKFAIGLGDSKFGNLRFMASGGSWISYAAHPTFFVNFFSVDNFLLDEDDKEFIKKQEQNFVNFLNHVMIGTSGIYLPRIIRHFEDLNEIWFHFAAVADGKRIRLYVNGKQKVSKRQGSSDRQNGPFINSQEPLKIGTGVDGVIDEVMILDHALTEDEIKEAMELGKNRLSLDRFLVDLQEISIVAPNIPQIYWTDRKLGRIQRTNLDGTNAEELVTGLIFPDEIALDEANGKIYWATNVGNERIDKIQRANLDGTNVENIVTTERNSGDGMALDIVGGKIYWASSVNDKIQRANLDGTNVQLLELKQVKQWLIGDLALDVAGGKIYWTAFVGGIQRANLDGTDAEKHIDIPAADIVLDVAGGKIYWVRGGIQRANLDGTNVENLVAWDGQLQSKIQSIVLDVAGDKMYWVVERMGKIRRANLDGTNVEDVVTGLSHPTGVALALPSAPNFGVEAQGKQLIQWGKIKISGFDK